MPMRRRRWYFRMSRWNNCPLTRRRGGRRRRRLAIDSNRFHEFGAGTIRVEEVDLALAIDAGFGLYGARVLLAVGPGLERGEGRVHIRHFETEVMLRAAMVGRRRLFGQHELDVVFAIGHFQIHPG